MNRLRKKLSYILFLLPLFASSQEMTGIVTGNYSGSNSIYMNPSLIANSHVNWDLNLFTGHVFLENNYFYLPGGETNIPEVIKGEYSFPLYPKPYGYGDRNVHTYYKDPSLKQINTNIRMVGPSFMFRHKDHAFAFHLNTRVITTLDDLPYDMANFAYFGSDFYPQHNINYRRDDYEMAALAFMEAGLSYATVLRRSGYSHWSAGITVNRIIANSGAYISGGFTDYILYNDSIMNVDDWNIEMGLSLPMDYHASEPRYVDDLVRGNGWGADIGVTWQYSYRGYRKKAAPWAHKKHFEPYDLRLGASILDLGFVRFDRNAEKHIFKDVSNHYINVEDLEFDNISQELRDVSELFYGDPEASYAASSFRIWLPVALSLQADWHIEKEYYLSGMVVLPMYLSKAQLRRPALVNASPRFETRALGIGLPVTLYDFRYPRIGFWIRVYDLTVGTDKLGGYLPGRDFTGMDLYASYKITFPFRTKSRYERRNPCYFNY